MPTATGCSTSPNSSRGSLAARERLAKWEDEYRQRIERGRPGGGTPAGDRPVGGVRQTCFARDCKSRTGRRDGRSFGRLVKKVEIDEQEVRIVYRVSPSPFERRPPTRLFATLLGA